MVIHKEEERIRVRGGAAVPGLRTHAPLLQRLRRPRLLWPCPSLLPLHPSQPPNATLEMVPLEFPEKPCDGEGNFLEGESTLDVPLDSVLYLKAAYDLLCRPFVEFLDRSFLDFVIIDFSSPWV